MKAEKHGDRDILIEFAPVYDKLDTFSCEPGKLAFTAQDKEGLIMLQEYVAVGRNKILLKFERVLGEECVLQGAFEKDM